MTLELLFAEGGGPSAAERLAAAARGEGRPAVAAKLAEAHLKGKPDDGTFSITKGAPRPPGPAK